MIIRYPYAFNIALLLAVLAGCAAGPNPTLERVQTEYVQAQQNPELTAKAPAAMQEAGSTLNRAERVWQDQQDAEEVEHLAYLTQQRLAIARARTEQKQAQQEIEQLRNRRQDLLLDARTQEAQQAQRQAQLAQQRAQQLEQQLAQQLAEFQARETERGLLLTLGDVLFEVGKADLKPGTMRKLAPIAQFLQQNPNRNLLVEGHTDSTGSTTTNQALSEARAEAVAGFLISQGVSPVRITTMGYGAAYPVAPNTTSAGRQQNRRVEIVILKEGEAAAMRMRS